MFREDTQRSFRNGFLSDEDNHEGNSPKDGADDEGVDQRDDARKEGQKEPSGGQQVLGDEHEQKPHH